jgi:Site-specific recombinase XerD
LKNTHLRAQIRLSEWVDTYIGQQERKGARGLKLIRSTRRLLHLYNDQVKMGNIDLLYCKGLIDWIKYTYKTRFGKPLTPKSVCDYLGYFTTILNAAVREDIIADNPMLKIAPDDRVKVPESKREYLSLDELRAMIETPCYREDVKRAYLFSCFCGLRIGDIERLKWKDLTKDGNQWRATIVMQKTTTPLYLPLSEEAMRWLPERGEAGDNDIIFNTLPTQECGSIHLKEWAKSAGVTKKITYHTARHTFATMMLTLGADIYTTSKLLGHSKVTTTQIYAKIIDPKKVETVNLTNGLFD